MNDVEKEDNKRVVLYTIHCHNCDKLEKMLNDKGIKYEVNESIEDMSNLGFKSAPMLDVDGIIYNYDEARRWLRTL